MSDNSKLCLTVAESMADVLDGSASADLYDHLAECDHCRDARHDAEHAGDLVRQAGADFAVPLDLEERLLAALDAAPVSRSDERAPTTLVSSASDAERGADGAGATEVPESEARAPAPRTVAARTESGLATKPPSSGASAGREAGGVARPGAGVAGSAGGGALRWVRRPRNAALTGLVGAALAAAAVGLLVHPTGSGESDGRETAQNGWRGTVALVSRAAPGQGGLEACDAEGACRSVAVGEPVVRGTRLRTDGSTRARVALDDGTELVLDRGTVLALDAVETRRASLEQGAIVAEVAEKAGTGARFDVPTGRVEVLGTKLAIRATDRWASVDVSRGHVRLVDKQERAVSVRSGEEGRIYAGMAPYAAAAPALGEALAWSETNTEELGEVRGLGELVARKPGSTEERVGAVRLAVHKVKVRIADGFARTEVDETFANSSSDVLEGIYRFPIPPDAQIDRLALEVDGKMEEGAFVDRERAAAIWRGAIVNAEKRQPKPREEIIWVPGPWRDPALLEWQRGGRFELKIYPIPAKGSRRVVLSYTQALPPSGGARRYVYPLPHDERGTTAVDDFGVDVQVKGFDPAVGVSVQGYDFERKNGEEGAARLALSRRNFRPSGDMVIEYALPDRDAEVTAWAYEPESGASRDPVVAATPGKEAAKLDEVSPYAALAIRPRLADTAEETQRDFVLVVDASRSMVGERYKRAGDLASRLVEELDRLDRFNVLACDTTCRPFAPSMQVPGHQVAREVKAFLEASEPEGGSDVARAVREAAGLFSSRDGRSLRVIYLGDGSPTVGPVRPAYLSRAVEEALPAGQATLTAVAIGADADLDSLSALARGGAGVVLPYVPGERTADAVYGILGASYGVGLSDVTVELPEGMREVVPRKLDTIPAGGEALVLARMSKPHVTGTIKLRGRVGGKPFEASYPIDVVASKGKGNSFLPRLYAAARIGELERDTSATARDEAVALSQQFDVASRYTSLLVLESEAMFKAFGLDNSRSTPDWTGEEATESTGRRDEAEGGDLAQGKSKKSAGSGRAPMMDFDGADEPSPQDREKDATSPWAGPPASAGAPAATATMAAPFPPPPPAAAKPAARPGDPLAAELDDWRPRRGMIPMRKVWERTGVVVTGRLVPVKASSEAIAEAERALEQNGDRRDAVKSLFGLYAQAGDVASADALAERWAKRDALDPDALVARADVAARKGERERAVRILEGVLDVRNGDAATYRRLGELHAFAGRNEDACRHLVALAQLRTRDADALADAVRCGRRGGESAMVDDMLSSADAQTRRQAQAALDRTPPSTAVVSGDLVVDATWQGSQNDLDIALVGPKGQRISWLGGLRTANQRLTVADATSLSREKLGLRGSDAGEWVIEIVRAQGEGTVQGSVVVTAAGVRSTIPFVLSGERVSVGLAVMGWKSRLVPM